MRFYEAERRLSGLTDGPIARVIKTVFAFALLLALCHGSYRVVRNYQEEVRATNERLARELEGAKKPHPCTDGASSGAGARPAK